MSTASAPFGPPPPQDPQEPVGTAPVAPALQSIDDARARFQEVQAAQALAQEGQILANFRTTVDTDPGVAAQALQVARDLGLDPNLLTDDDVRRVAIGVHERRDVARRQLLERSPVLARRLRDAQFTSVARDDLDNLQTTETQFSDLGKAYRRGKLQVEIGMLGAKLAARRAFEGGEAARNLEDLPPDDLQHYRALKARLDRLGESTGFLDNATEVVGQMVQTLPVAIASGLAAATPAAIAGPAAAGPAFVVGSLTSAFATTAALEGGSFYVDMREKGYTHDEALMPSLAVAAVNGTLEVAGEVVTALPFARALRREIARVGVAKVTKEAVAAGASKEVVDSLAKATVGKAATQAAKEYGTSVTTEVSTEVLQEVMSVIGEELTRTNAPEGVRAVIRGQNAGEIVDRLLDIALKTAKAMLVLGAPGPILNFASESRRIRAADHYAQRLAKLSELAAASKTRERAPSAFGAAAQDMAEENGVPTVFIEPKELAAAIDADEQDHPGARERFKEKLPDIYAQIEPATREGELVEIPTGTYLAQIAGTPMQARLDPHLKHAADAFSPAEAEEKRDEVKKLVKAADEATADTGSPEQRKAAKKLRDERKQVEKLIEKRLKAVAEAQPEMRVAPEQIKGQAQVMAAVYTALAKTLGVSPLELEALRPVTVLPGRQQAASAEDLQQAARRVTESPEFKAWFGDSKVVDKEGAPLVVYHGTARPDRIGSRFRRTRATSGPMAFFTDDPGVASGYAAGKQDTSLSAEDQSFETWFTFRAGRFKGNLRSLWFNLTPEERKTVSERAGHVTQNDEGDIVYDENNGGTGIGGYDQHLREARGNPILALVEEWLNSATLFNDEIEFLKVLRLAGVNTDISFQDPSAQQSGVFPVFLRITNPLDTGAIPEEVLTDLEKAGARKRGSRGGADPWDKSSRSGRQWLDALAEDRKAGTSLAWTSIPDWVTETLQRFGYDGVRDTGGKHGGVEHTVWVPFTDTQVKSVNNRGTFDPNDPNILKQAGAPQFYSALLRGVEALPTAAAPASGWRAALKGLVNKGLVKQDEVTWSGIEEWLALQSGKVTREQVVAFLQQNGVQVEEVTLGMASALAAADRRSEQADFALSDRLQAEGVPLSTVHAYMLSVHLSAGTQAEIAPVAGLEVTPEVARLTEEARAAFQALRELPASGPAKFSTWKVPGGTNYREVLLTLPPDPNAARARAEIQAKIDALVEQRLQLDESSAPQIPVLSFEEWLQEELTPEYRQPQYEAENRKDYQRWVERSRYRWVMRERARLLNETATLRGQLLPPKARFSSSHWDTPNVLAHIRLTDREDTDGARVLFVEEIQSDWAQQGREAGFAQPPDGLDLGGVKDARPPEAPFVGKTDAWVTLALKRALLLAAEGGYDKLALANGEQNAEHYDLSKHLSEIRYNSGSHSLRGYDAETGKEVIDEVVTPEDLPRYIGKETAGKILEQLPSDSPSDWRVMRARDALDDLAYAENPDAFVVINPNGEVVFNRYGDLEEFSGEEDARAFIDDLLAENGEDIRIRGLDLKVGGEGMRAFYDQIVPSNLKALVRKLGGKVDTVAIPVDPESVVGSPTGLLPVDVETAKALHKNGVTLWVGRPAETGVNYEQLPPGNTDLMVTIYGSKAQFFRKAQAPLQQIGVELTDEMRAKLAEGLPLFQGGGQQPLGFFSSKLAAIVLNPGANPSTVLHEMVHWYADTLLQESRGGNAGAQAQAAAMLRLFGVESVDAWDALTPEQRAVHHETLAYSWEQYLAEGKAPSLELESLFQKIAAFMRRVYRQLVEIATNYKQATGQDLPPLSPEMRRFFDLLLASEDAITRAQAVRGQVPLFLNREQARALGVDDKTWAEYEELRRMEADAAAGQLAADMMRHARWMQNAVLASRKGLQAELDAKRVKLRAQVDTEIRATKVYSAIEVLTRGELDAGDGEKVALKLDRNSVALGRRWLKGNEEKLAPLSTENGTGVSPDFAAALLGFRSGDEMLTAIFDAPPLDTAVDQETDARLQQNELLADPQAFKEAVDRALQNKIRERVMAAELKMLGGAQRPTRLTLAAVKEAAQQIVARTKVGELDAERGYAAMARASRRAQAAVAEGNVEAALLALRQQMVQTQIARLATDAKREVMAAQVKFRPMFRTDKKIAKQRNLATVNIARAVLARWGLGNGEDAQRFLDLARQLEPDTASRMEAEVARATIDAPAPGKGKLAAPYANATVEQFRAMRDEVLMLWHLAERERTIGVGAERVELDKAVDELLAQLQRTMPAPRGDQPVAQPERDAANFRYFLASLKQAEHWVARVDGGLDGPMRRLFWRPLREAYDSYLSHRGAALTKLHAAFREIKGTLSTEKLDASSFVPGLSFNGTLELLGALAHSGNESNLAILLEGYGWEQRNAEGQLDTSRWFDFLDKMMKGGVITQQHVKFVQALWDFNQHELAPVSQRAMRDLFGVFWEPIEATPVPTPWGEMRGGYVPARPDPMHPKNAARNRGAADLTSQLVEGEAGFREAMPGSRAAGHTITRTGATYPVTLDLRVQLQHLDEAMRFAYLQPALRDAARLVTAPRFATELARVDPTALQGVLLPTLQATMRNQLTVPPAKPTGRMIAMLANALRRSTGLGFMFLSVRNALQQLSGLSNASQYVPLRHLRAGVWDALFSPQISTRDAMRKSTFMRLRLDEEIGQLSEDIENVLDPSITPTKRAVNRYGYVLQRLMQGRTDVAVWHAAFADALERGKTDADAIAHADSVVRLSQGSQTPIDVADYQRAGALGRLLTQFTGYFNTVLNQIASQQGAGPRTVAVARALLVPTLIATAIAALLAPSKDFEDKDGDGDVWDEWFAYFAKAEASGALAMLPVLGPAVAAQFLTGDHRPGGDRITPAPFWVVVQAAGRLATLEGDGRVSGREIRDAATVLSALTGVPVTPLGRLAAFLADVEAGRAKVQGPGDFVRGVLNGR